jgi:acyl-CoA thioester hydrolase
MKVLPEHLVEHLAIPIAWGEQDAFGHLNNTAMIRYMESVRMHYLEHIGVLRSMEEKGIGVVLASTTCDYLRPVHWPATLHAHAGCKEIGETSFTMEYLITDAEGTPVAKGTSVQVMYDFRKKEKVDLPLDIVAGITCVRYH